jgi:hypothetical protein
MMIYRICATLMLAAVYLFLSIEGIPESTTTAGSLMERGGRTLQRQFPQAEVTTISAFEDSKWSTDEFSVPNLSPAAQYSESDHSWSFSARLVQVKDVSIYGKPGTVGMIEYIRDGELEYGWVVTRIENYYFSENPASTLEGQAIMLEVSGEHVSSEGVNWEACSSDDGYCGYAKFIEGGFPASEDYNGLTICPSNELIYSGYASDDWINGMLAWKIKILS